VGAGLGVTGLASDPSPPGPADVAEIDAAVDAEGSGDVAEEAGGGDATDELGAADEDDSAVADAVGDTDQAGAVVGTSVGRADSTDVEGTDGESTDGHTGEDEDSVGSPTDGDTVGEVA